MKCSCVSAPARVHMLVRVLVLAPEDEKGCGLILSGTACSTRAAARHRDAIIVWLVLHPLLHPAVRIVRLDKMSWWIAGGVKRRRGGGEGCSGQEQAGAHFHEHGHVHC